MIESARSGNLFCYKCSDTRQELEHNLRRDKNFFLGDIILIPGQFYDLHGYWVRPIQFIGSKGSELYFYIGYDKAKHYYEYFHWITPYRFFINTYKGQAGRDYNFINGKWDWQRPSSKTKR